MNILTNEWLSVLLPRYRAATTRVMFKVMSTLLSGSAQNENPTITRKMVTGRARRSTIPEVRSHHNPNISKECHYSPYFCLVKVMSMTAVEYWRFLLVGLEDGLL